MSNLHEEALKSKAWPFDEARKVLKRLKGQLPEKGYVLFETGYGPSGLPHIGTFGEVARTAMIQHNTEIYIECPLFRKDIISTNKCTGFNIDIYVVTVTLFCIGIPIDHSRVGCC